MHINAGYPSSAQVDVEAGPVALQQRQRGLRRNLPHKHHRQVLREVTAVASSGIN